MFFREICEHIYYKIVPPGYITSYVTLKELTKAENLNFGVHRKSRLSYFRVFKRETKSASFLSLINEDADNTYPFRRCTLSYTF